MSEDERIQLRKDLLYKRETLTDELRDIETELKKRGHAFQAVGERLLSEPATVRIEKQNNSIYLTRRDSGDTRSVPMFALDLFDLAKLAGLIDQFSQKGQELAQVNAQLKR